MAMLTTNYQDADCVKKVATCTDLASGLLERFNRIRLTLDRIEGTNSEGEPDEDVGPGALPLLELRLRMANRDAEDIMARIDALANRI